MKRIVPASGALAEMLARDAERDDDQPFGSYAQFAAPQPEPAPAPPPQPFRPPPPDWEAERIERLKREQAEHEAPPAEEPPESLQERPVPKRGKVKQGPRSARGVGGGSEPMTWLTGS